MTSTAKHHSHPLTNTTRRYCFKHCKRNYMIFFYLWLIIKINCDFPISTYRWNILLWRKEILSGFILFSVRLNMYQKVFQIFILCEETRFLIFSTFVVLVRSKNKLTPKKIVYTSMWINMLISFSEVDISTDGANEKGHVWIIIQIILFFQSCNQNIQSTCNPPRFK